MIESEVFGCKTGEKVNFHQDVVQKSAALAHKLKSLMQFNRLHKLIASRLCEHVYILRKSY